MNLVLLEYPKIMGFNADSELEKPFLFITSIKFNTLSSFFSVFSLVEEEEGVFLVGWWPWDDDWDDGEGLLSSDNRLKVLANCWALEPKADLCSQPPNTICGVFVCLLV